LLRKEVTTVHQTWLSPRTITYD